MLRLALKHVRWVAIENRRLLAHCLDKMTYLARQQTESQSHQQPDQELQSETAFVVGFGEGHAGPHSQSPEIDARMTIGALPATTLKDL